MSQDHLKDSDMWKVKDGLYLGLSSLIVFASGFLIPVSFAKWATKESYGQFSYVISLMGLLNLFCLPGMNDAITQGIARGENGIWFPALRTRIRWTLIGIGVLWVIGGWFFVRKGPLGMVLFILAPFLLTYVLDSTKAFLSGHMAFRTVACVNAGANFLPPLTVILLLAFGHHQVLWTSLGYFFTLFGFYTVVFLTILVVKRPTGTFSKETLRYGKHMSVISSLGTFQGYVDKVIVGSLLGFVDLAHFSVASLFQAPVKLLSWGVLYPQLLPNYAKISATDLRKEIAKWLKFTVFFGGLGMAGFLFAVKMIVELAFGESYHSVIPFAMLFIISGFFLVPGMIFDIALRSQQMKAEMYVLRIGQVIVTVLSLLILIPIFSLLGAVLADLISNILYSFLGFFLNLRIGKKVEAEVSLAWPFRPSVTLPFRGSELEK